MKARRLKAKIATKPVSKVQLCGCCDVQSGWKFISEVAGNLSPIHPSGGSKKIHLPPLFNFLYWYWLVLDGTGSVKGGTGLYLVALGQ